MESVNKLIALVVNLLNLLAAYQCEDRDDLLVITVVEPDLIDYDPEGAEAEEYANAHNDCKLADHVRLAEASY